MEVTCKLATMAILAAVACDPEAPSTIVVDNDYPVVRDGGDASKEMTVFKVWWADGGADAAPPDATETEGAGR